jgi:hypothetical protein
MGQSFLCESFSSKIDKTRRKNETINQTPPSSMDYEKQSGSEDSQPDGSQRLRCTLTTDCHLENNIINLKLQLPTIRRNRLIKTLSFEL